MLFVGFGLFPLLLTRASCLVPCAETRRLGRLLMMDLWLVSWEPLEVVLSFALHTGVTGGYDHLQIHTRVSLHRKCQETVGPTFFGEEEDVLFKDILSYCASLRVYSADMKFDRLVIGFKPGAPTTNNEVK
jgi:hypothetical protein